MQCLRLHGGAVVHERLWRTGQRRRQRLRDRLGPEPQRGRKYSNVQLQERVHQLPHHLLGLHDTLTRVLQRSCFDCALPPAADMHVNGAAGCAPAHRSQTSFRLRPSN